MAKRNRQIQIGQQSMVLGDDSLTVKMAFPPRSTLVTIDGVPNKLCSGCNTMRPVSEFAIDRRNQNSASGLCTPCSRKRQYEALREYKERVKDSTEERICSKCHESKLLRYFPYGRTMCQPCRLNIVSESKARYRRDHGLGYSTISAGKSFENYIKSLTRTSKFRAKKRGNIHTVDASDLMGMFKAQDGKCALSGREMTFIIGKGHILSNISIDQIEPSRGYTLENIQLVCRRVNEMKADMALEQFLLLCQDIADHTRPTNE